MVFLNSFDPEKDEIEDEVSDKKIETEVFEIDRVRPQDRTEYLNCLHDLAGTKRLPIIFVGD